MRITDVGFPRHIVRQGGELPATLAGQVQKWQPAIGETAFKLASNRLGTKMVDQQQAGKQGLTLNDHYDPLAVGALANHAVDFKVTKFDPQGRIQ